METAMPRYLTRLLVAFAAMFMLHATPAAAQATRTWVSGVGDDVNPCSRTAPCKTFAGAISKTAPSGEINCLDSAGFGTVTITKAITIKCDGVIGGILASSVNGIIINAGTGDRVVIDGLDINGFGTGLNGIRILSARDVVVRNSLIYGFNAATPNGSAIVVDSGAVKVNLTVENTTFTGNQIGVRVQSTGGLGSARIFRSLFATHAVAGVSVTGAGNLIDISDSQIIRSPKGLEILSGGAINSYGDNVLTPGDAPTIVPKG
jgi:hypothetical protein